VTVITNQQKDRFNLGKIATNLLPAAIMEDAAVMRNEFTVANYYRAVPHHSPDKHKDITQQKTPAAARVSYG